MTVKSCFTAMLVVAGLCGSMAASAQPFFANSAAMEAERQIRARMAQSRPDMKIASVEPTPMAGIYAVRIDDGPTIYSSADGNYFVFGDLYSVGTDSFVNESELVRQRERRALLARVNREDMIIFPAKGTSRSSVYIFTDVDCFYCQKLHREVPKLNDLGVEVRYLAYPRAGVGSPTYKKMVSAWCADDQRAALTALKNGQQIPTKSCDTPIRAQYNLGSRVGVEGTPAIVTSSGRLVPGYMPADRLAAVAQGKDIQ